jgi:DNA (cytosine-5)-methyltransferase 1
MTRPYYEFFAGGGMARAGLGSSWTSVFANDVDSKKAASYVANWGSDELRVEDVARLTPADLPGVATLAWASFPCQDLSLAGVGAGLKGQRSGTFWPFWKLMTGLSADERAARLIVLENVCGALTSYGGRDFAAIGAALAEGGYRFGAMVIDAAHNDYVLPENYNEAYHLAGDGVAVPVVRFLAEHILEPVLAAARRRAA